MEMLIRTSDGVLTIIELGDRPSRAELAETVAKGLTKGEGVLNVENIYGDRVLIPNREIRSIEIRKG